MATEAELRRRLQQLEKQLSDMRQEFARHQEKIKKQTQEQIQQMQRQTQAAFQRKLRETEEEYARRIRAFQEETARQSRITMDALTAQARQMQQDMQAVVAQIEEANRELVAEVKRMRDDTKRQNETFRAAAETARKEAVQAQHAAEQTPHGFFCPEEFGIISSQIEDLPVLIEQGMYQAAVSDANSMALQFRLLQVKVEQAFSEWLMAFDDYCRILETLAARIEEFERSPIKTELGEFKMGPLELNFWSSGTYATLRAQIMEARDTFCPMSRAQVIAYLQGAATGTRRAIFDKLKEAHRWEDQLSAVMNCICSERVMSDQRFRVADVLARKLEAGNYCEEENAFKAPTPLLCEQEWYTVSDEENPMDTHVLCMCLAESNRVELLAIPTRSHGLCVANEFFLRVDFHSTASPESERAVGTLNVRRLQESFPGIHIRFVSRAEKPERVIGGYEQQYNTAPNPQAQIQHLERKYQ